MAKTRTSGQGRPKGAQNRITKDLKAMILGALTKAGGQAYLTRQAKANPKAFLALLGRILPMEVTGKDGDPLASTHVTIYMPGNGRDR